MISRCRSVALAIALLFLATAPTRSQDGNAEAAKNRAYSITESGQDRTGNPLFTVRAHGADIKEFLGAVLSAGKRSFKIDVRVRGKVDLFAEKYTVEMVLLQCYQSTQAFKFSLNKDTILISPPDSQFVRPAPGLGMVRPGDLNTNLLNNLLNGQRPGLPGYGSNGSPYLNRPIQFAIPDAQPLRLQQALDLLARQSGMRFRLHPDIRPDVLFSGTVKNLPLRSVLDSLGRTANLTWNLQRDGAVLISPLPRVERPAPPKAPEGRKGEEEEAAEAG